MDFLDRVDERGRLGALVARRAAGLVAVWGRRRIGKSRLLVEWCQQHDGLYTVADQSAEAVQRRYFAGAVSTRLPGFADADYPNWQVLLARLSRDARSAGWRGPVVFDEFPWLVSACPGLPAALQNWIDNEASQHGLLVAICGSSQRMMQGLVLGADAPLYGRSLEAFALEPLPVAWIGQALGLADPAEAVRAYAVWGGVPRYWELAQPHGRHLDVAVDRLALDPAGPLHQEPDRLLLEEQPPATALRPILDVIGAGANRLSEIAGRLGQPATSLSRPLSRLVDLAIVERDIPFGESERSSRRALYRIADPFFRFWFRVVAPHRAAFAATPPATRIALWRRYQSALEADTWERLCRAAVAFLPPGLLDDGTGEPDDRRGRWLPARRWWHGQSPEWDILATTVDNARTLVGEAKWAIREMTEPELVRYATALEGRPLPPVVQGAVTRVLFVPALAPGAPRRVGDVTILDAAVVVGEAGKAARG